MTLIKNTNPSDTIKGWISEGFVYYTVIAGAAIVVGRIFFLVTDLARFMEKLNVEQKKIIGDVTQTSQHDFLRSACKLKKVCKKYPDVKQGCAAAGSIQKCIDIQMKGEDSSMCLDDGGVVGFNDKTRPSFAQCTAFKVSDFFSPDDDSHKGENIYDQKLKSSYK